MDTILYKIDHLVEGTIIKRPSSKIKSPYVADTVIKNTDKEVLAHTVSLGCCGLSHNGSRVLMSRMNKQVQCEYAVYLSLLENNENIVGIHPKLGEKIVENALKQNLLTKLQHVKCYKKEATIFAEGKVNSRFDFVGQDQNNIPFIMEVKNVPLADYEEVDAKKKDKINYEGRDFHSKVAYFPDGYRKKNTDTVSPRALKHLQELTLIKKESITRCIMCYVIQRTDVNRFQPSIQDPEYRKAFKEAIDAGVEMITLVVRWNYDGTAYFVKDNLPIVEF